VSRPRYVRSTFILPFGWRRIPKIEPMTTAFDPPDIPELKRGSVLRNAYSGESYRIGETLGQGGFGAAYRAKSTWREQELCIKVTSEITSWVVESYMSELFWKHPRVLTVWDYFPVAKRSGPVFVITMELAEGTVEDLIEKEGPQPEKWVVAQSRALLGAVAYLHERGAVHRDITPFNVLYCGRHRTLKLGDFGIATHGPKGRPAADAFNPGFVHRNLRQKLRACWSVGEDLWQVGQLMAMLLTGRSKPIPVEDVREIKCSDTTKYVIRRAIDEASLRFLSASAMADALKASEPIRYSTLRSLAGKRVMFTGPMGDGLVRRQAALAAQRKGAHVVDEHSARMDVLVIGEESPNWVAGGEGGRKILGALALRDRGHDVKFITGDHFRKLTDLRK
jgi:hypothetical protein